MVRIKKMFLLLICLPFLLLICRSWLHFRGKDLDNVFWTPISGFKSNDDNRVDRIRVKNNNQRTDMGEALRTIDRYEDLNDYVNINGNIITLDDNQTSSDRLCDYCRFTTPEFLHEHKPYVALASFPGSGNSWTRELLESITVVYTGSIYVDSRGQFPGSKSCPQRGGVYIIKTHRHDNQTNHVDCNRMHAKTIYYQRAMFILRNPYDALLSLFNLIRGGKVGFARREEFKTARWLTFVKKQSRAWTKMTLYWLTKFEKPLHVIVYEKLKTDTTNELINVARFLHLNSTDLDFYCAKTCLKPKYHRVKSPEWMNTSILFNDKSKHVVNSEINDTIHGVREWDILGQALKRYIKET